ncbi:MAG: hypothetical protein V4643_06310 [Bacteroidota bacterium]
MANKELIGFQLVGIRTEQFAIVEQEVDANNELAFTISFNVGKNDDDKVLSVLFSAKFLEEEKTIMILECSCHFKVIEESWSEFKEQGTDNLIVPQGFITHLAVITVGTARGILHAKTEGTKFNGHILPTINLTEIFTSDARIE